MIDVLFFASIREQLDCAKLSVAFPEGGCEIATLVDLLEGAGDLSSVEPLRQDNVVVALNQVKVDMAHNLKDGDEVAFYPPVTGG